MVSPPRSLRQRALADSDSVADGQVVAAGEIDAVVDLDAGARCSKMWRPNMQRKRRPSHGSGRWANGRTSSRPEQRFALGIALASVVGKVLRSRVNIGGVERERRMVPGSFRGQRDDGFVPCGRPR